LKAFRIVIFDLDGVLVSEKSSWEAVHKALGMEKEGQINLRGYLKGEFDYKEFMSRDIALWKNTDLNGIRTIVNRISLTNGARETVHSLKKLGLKTAIISSGISVLADRVKAELEIDYAFSNKITEDKNGKIIGIEVVPVHRKASVMRKLARLEGVSTRNCIVVGDGIYDVPMFKIAGFSIAFNSDNDEVKGAADISIDKKDLREIIPYIKLLLKRFGPQHFSNYTSA